MNTQHQEFPIMAPGARAAHDAAINAIQNGKATISCADLWRVLAASLREAIEQATDRDGGFSVNELFAIADNLHSPPPPPTLAEAREAARQLAGPSAEVVHAFLASLGEREQA